MDEVEGPDRVGALDRPAVRFAVSERLREWIAWFGLVRMVTSAVAVIVVCAGTWLLVRSPTPPIEATLPMATTSTSVDAEAPTTGPSPAPVSETVVVHVAGAVASPGVYQLPVGSRVADSIERAGGAVEGADPGMLNLAAVVSDGSRVFVPAEGDEVPTELVVGGVDGITADATPGGRLVDVNRASAAQLETLPGVGPATAAAIIDERASNGPFATADDLERVPGIGPVRLAAIIDLVTT